MGIDSELEKRVRVLEDIEAIKKLKAKYWNSVDTQQWDNLADCYTEDVVFESPMLGKMEGRDFIVKVLKRAMKNIKTAHQGHNPEIKVYSDTAARGSWALNDRVQTENQKFLKGCGYYQDEYIKVNGSWKIKSSILTYTFQERSNESY
jgi:ketosteroid isomerase-like protein